MTQTFIHIHILESYLPDYIPIRLGNGKRHMEEYTYEYLADGELRDVYHRVDNAYRANHLLYYTYDNARRVFLKRCGRIGCLYNVYV